MPIKTNRILNIKFYTINIILILCLSLCGCTIEEQEVVKKENKEHIPLKFGATYMTMNNPYFEALDDSIEQVINANGDVLISRDPAQDQEKQNQQIQEMIDSGVVAIFVNPVDWKGVKPALIACKEAGIPIFNVDTYVYDSKYVTSSILSDNYNAGVQIAKDVMTKRKSAKITIINHENINSTALRVQGFLDTIKGHEEYEVVIHEKITAELEVAMEITKKIIDDDILIYGIDGSPDGKTMIKKGFLEGTSAQFPIEMGTTAADTAYEYLEGKKVESNYFSAFM